MNVLLANLKKRHLFAFILLLFLGAQMGFGQNCSVNAGVAETICENTAGFSLSGSAAGLIQSGPTWSQVGGPSVLINDPSDVNTSVTGFVGGNDYTFRLSAVCTDGSTQFQDVVITVQPITIADAGDNIASCPDSTGTLVTNANAPANPGEVGTWSIVGSNNAGVTILDDSSPTTGLNLADTSAGTTTLQWTIRGPDYLPGVFCESTATITVTNTGGVAAVDAGANQTLDNCYTVSQSTNLNATFGGNGINGQIGTWSFVSGPNAPTISNVNSRNTGVSNLIEGTYEFRWSVSGPCANGEDTVTITVQEATQDISTASVQEDNIRFCDASITTTTLVGSQPQFAGETVQWNQTEGPVATILNPTSSTTQISGLDGSSTYRFTYTITNSTTGCDDTADVVIRYSTNPITMVANGGNDLLAACGATSVDIPFAVTGNGSNTFSIVSGPAGSTLIDPNTFSNTGSSPLNINFDVQGTYTVVFRRALTGSIQTGCDEATDAVNVTISLNPTSANAGTDLILSCNTTTADITGNAIGVGTSLWSQVSGPSTATVVSPFERTTTVQDLVPGIYVFQYAISGGNACSPSAESTVEINVSTDAPVVTSAGSAQTICFGTPTQLDATPAPASNLVGTWSVVSPPSAIGVVAFADENDPKTLVSGLDDPNTAYTLRWTVENPVSAAITGIPCPAPGFSDVVITTNATQGPSLANAGTDQCLPLGTNTVTLDADAPQPGETGVWTSNPVVGISFVDATQFDTDITIASPSTNQSYILTWTISGDPSCQSTSDDVEVSIGATASADAGPDQTVCYNPLTNTPSITLDASGSIGSGGSWRQVSGPGGFIIDDTNPTTAVSFTNSGQYVFEWTATQGSCSSDSDTVTLNIGIEPTTATVVQAVEEICTGTTVTLDGNIFDANTENGFWTLLSGAPNNPTFSDVNDPTATVSDLVSGTYVFRWTITGDSNCTAPNFADKTVNVFVPADAGSDLSLCEVSDLLLEATFGSTGTWTQIDGPGVNGNPGTPATITQNPVDSNVAQISIIPGNDYEFEFTTNYAGTSGCGNTSDQVLVSSSTSPSVDPDAGPDQILCRGDLLVLDQTTLAGNAAPLDVDTATWRFSEQPSGSVAVIDSPNSPTSTLSGLSVPGIYILEWNFSTGNCSDTSDVIRIEVFDAPSVADAGTNQTTACQLDATLAAVPPTAGVGTWTLFSAPAGETLTIDSPNSPTSTVSGVTAPGTYTLRWTVGYDGITFPDSLSACDPTFSDVDITFTANPPSNAEAGPDQELCAATQTTMAGDPITVGTGTWSQTAGPGFGGAPGTLANIVTPSSPTTTIDTLEPGTYEFTWSVVSGGCTVSDVVEVIIYGDPGTAEAGPNQTLDQFSAVVLGATAPAAGIGVWTQVSGPTTVGFVNENDPNTEVFGASDGTYVFEWTVSNGNCPISSDTVEISLIAVDLELTKTASFPTANPGDVITFTIDIFNNDASTASDATGISVRDVIPSGYTLVPGTVSNGGIYNVGDLSITWSNLSVLNGATLSLTFDVTVNATGDSVNTAEITASDIFDIDSTPANGIGGEDDQDSAQVTVNVADISLSKGISGASSATPDVGDTVVFEVDVTNDGPQTATNVSIQDVIPSGFTVGTINDGGTLSGSTITWDIASLTVGTTTLTYEVTVNAPTGAADEYGNTVQVSGSDQPDPDSTPNNDDGDQSEDDESAFTITTPDVIDLEVDISVSDTAPSVGDVVTFTINLSNLGTIDATGVNLENLVPDGYGNVTGLTGGTFNAGTGIISWNGLTIPQGNNTETLTFQATVQAPTGSPGEYTHIVEVTAADQFDIDSTPNNDDGDQSEDDEDAVTTGITEVVDLSIAKNVIVGSTTPNVGDAVTFELIVSNAGPSNASGVGVEDILPAGFTLIAVNAGGSPVGNTAQWSGLFVPAGGNLALTYQATVNVPTGAAGEYANSAQITASNQPDSDSDPAVGPGVDDLGDTLPDDDEVTLTLTPQQANLSLDKSVSESNPEVGEEITFTVQINNAGPDIATNVSIEDVVPSGYAIVAGSVSNGGIYNFGGSTILWDLASVPLTGTTLTYRATVNAPTGAVGEYDNTAQVTASDQFDPNSTPNDGTGDDQDTESVIPNASDLSLVKNISVASSATPNVGDTVVFELTLTNAGPNDATSVVLEDIVPSGYTLGTVNNGGSAIAGTFITWNIGALPVGSTTVSYEVTVNAPTGATDEYLNTAELAGVDQFDPDSEPGNDDGDQDEDDEDFFEVTPQVVDIELEITASNTDPDVGDVVTFTINLSNLGADAASGVSIADLVPAGYGNITGISNGGSFSLATNTIRWSGLTVPVGSNTETLTFQATVLTPTGAVGEFTHIAEVTASDQFDSDSTPNNDDGDQSEDDEDSTTAAPQQANLSLTKIVVDNDLTPNVGEEISFEITISNTGPDDATNVEVTDLLPDGFDFVLYSATAGIYNQGTGLWQVGTLNSGTTETLVIDALVNPTGNYTNVAEITASDAFDINSTPNNNLGAEDDQDDVTITPVEIIDVSLTKTVDNLTPEVNSNVVFTLTVTNAGPSEATSLQVTDVIPSGFAYQSDDGGTDYDDGTGVWDIGSLASGATTILNITASVNTTGVYLNAAEVTQHDQVDVDSTPNNGVLAEDDQDQVEVTPIQLVDISVTKTADDLTPNVGDPIVFTVTVTNDGPSDATNIVVTDFLASGYEFVSAVPTRGVYEPLNGSWTLGNLDDGDTETIVITANVLANGEYINIAELTDLAERDIDSEPANNDDTEDDQQTIEPVPVLVSDLELRKSVDVLSPRVGDEVIFNISVENNGPSDVTGVQIEDLLPSGYTYVSNNRTAGVYNPTTGIWQLNGVIPNGTIETLNIVALVNPTGDYFNVAEVFSSSNLDPNSTPNNGVVAENDQDSAGTTPIPVSDLSLTKTVDNETPDVLDNVVFTLTLVNEGPSDATNVVVADLLPSGYTYVSDDSAGTYDSGTGLWSLPIVAGGTTQVLNITAQVNATGVYTNVAEVIAVTELDPDSTPGNNVSSEDDQDEKLTRPRILTDISLTKTVDNINPSVGSNITFTITVRNDGPNAATGLVIEDILASGYTFVGDLPSAGTYNNVTGAWDLASLANGATATLEITATVLPTGEYANTAELIALDTFDPDSTPDNNLNSEDDQDTVVPGPDGIADLSLTKTVDETEPNVGDVVEFTVNVFNGGSSGARGVVITDMLPVGYTFQSYISTAGIYNDETGVWSLNGIIPNGTTETLIILATVNMPTGASDEYLNQAQVTASNSADPDSDPGAGFDVDDLNDGLEDDDEASAFVIPQTTDIALTKTVDNPAPKIGDDVVFSITATNQGNQPATNIGIEEQIPAGYQLGAVQATIGNYDAVSGFWEIPSLDAQSTATLTLTVEVLDGTDYLNTASLSFVDQLDVDSSNDSAQATVDPSCLNVYNEFSPNGDGVNETFVIDCIAQYPNNLLQVYNRWGNLVFEQRSYNNDWDGISNGRATVKKGDLLPVGTYYYVLDLGDGSEPRTDWLYINR
ncbi:MAG: gliding motility-associated C-terminal domain-containing protein [Bacteroidota bacterium]